MKTFYLTTLLCFLLIAFATAQTFPGPIRFKNGEFIGNRNLQRGKLTKDLFKNAHYRKNYYGLIQFEKIPGVEQRLELARNGVVLFDYVPQNALIAEIQENFSLPELKKYNVSGGVYC